MISVDVAAFVGVAAFAGYGADLDGLSGWFVYLVAAAASLWSLVWWDAAGIAVAQARWSLGAHITLCVITLTTWVIVLMPAVAGDRSYLAVVAGALAIVMVLRYTLTGTILRWVAPIGVVLVLLAAALMTADLPFDITRRRHSPDSPSDTDGALDDGTMPPTSTSDPTATQQSTTTSEPSVGTTATPAGSAGPPSSNVTHDDCVPLADGVAPEVKDHMEAAAIDADPDYGCLLSPQAFDDGSVVQRYASADAMIVASVHGAGLVNGPAVRALDRTFDDDFSLMGLGGQWLRRIDCWGRTGDFHARVDENGTLNGLLSRRAKVVDAGDGTAPGEMFFVPPEILGDFAAYLAQGRLLAAVAPAVTTEAGTTQEFIDPTDENADPVVLSGSAAAFVLGDFTVTAIEEACAAMA